MQKCFLTSNLNFLKNTNTMYQIRIIKYSKRFIDGFHHTCLNIPCCVPDVALDLNVV